jgi:multiple RNA-binding domain-containing protein 1
LVPPFTAVPLTGHKLEMKLSKKKIDPSNQSREGKVTKSGGTKLLIRNIAFETDKKELRELCSAFGQIKSMRIPKKFDGTHRGFAFVDFISKKEAKNAFEALSVSTHLYGRRMVIEWAADDNSIETMQSKTKKTYGGDGRKGGRNNKRLKTDEMPGLA